MTDTKDRVRALTALQSLVHDELDKSRCDLKVEMLNSGTTKEDVMFCGQKVGDVRLVTEEISHIEVYPSSRDPATVWDLYVTEHGGNEKQVLLDLLGGGDG